MVIYDIQGQQIADVIVSQSARHEEELMKSDFVTLSWDDIKGDTLPVGTYIIPFEDGIRYALYEPYTPQRQSEAQWHYEPQFQHPKMYLGKIPFARPSFDTEGNSISLMEWQYTGFIETLLGYFCTSINTALGITGQEEFGAILVQPQIGVIDGKPVTLSVENNVSVSFSSQDILSALSNVANVLGCEWHIDWEARTLYFGHIIINRTGLDAPTLEVGVNIGMPSARDSKEGFWNAYQPQGSTRNIIRRTITDENVQSNVRLSLNTADYPDGMIYTDDDGNVISSLPQGKMPFIKSLIFENVYPRQELYVYDVKYRERFQLEDDNNPESKVIDHYDGSTPVYKKYAVWYFRLASPSSKDSEGNVTAWNENFDLSDIIIDGKRPIIAFQPNLKDGAQSSPLAGRGDGDGEGHYGFYLRYLKMEGSTYIATANSEPTKEGDTGVIDAHTGLRSLVTENHYEIEFQQQNDYILPTTASQGIVPKGQSDPSMLGNLVSIYNIVAPQSMESVAQEELALETKKFIKEQFIDNNTYSFNSNPVVFNEDNPNLFIGQSVTYKNGDYILPTRVMKLVTQLDYPFQQEISVGNEVLKGSQTTIKEAVNTLIAAGASGGGSGTVSEAQIQRVVESYGGARFLSRQHDDTAQGKITFLKGLESVGDAMVRGVLTAWRAVMNVVRSDNYTTGFGGTGFELTNDNGAGSSQLTVDYIHARKKLIAESMEVKEYHASAGDQLFTGATAKISRVDYLDAEGSILGMGEQKVPFTLNSVMLMLRKLVKPWGVASTLKTVRTTLTAVEKARIKRVRCYFLAADGEREVENLWAVNDLALCKTQNVVSSQRDTRLGSGTKAGNVYWWRKVAAVSACQQPVTLEDGKQYHWIDFPLDYAEETADTPVWNNSDYESDVPAAGDAVIQFGNTENPERMNAICLEVNGVGNQNAPDIMIYRGIYCYDLSQCWWGGESCMKGKWSAATGLKVYGPSFEFITEYGTERMPVDRGAWLSITPDENNQRRCFYYDRVSHKGSLWLCTMTERYQWQHLENGVWVNCSQPAGEYDTTQYRYQPNYTVQEPDDAATDWTKQVSKGEKAVPKAAYLWNQSPTAAPSPLPENGAQLPSNGWTATAPNRPGDDYYLWMTQCSTYADGSYTNWEPAVCISGGRGSAGEDAREREWIYTGKSEPTTFSGDTLPANIRKDTEGTTRTADYIATTDDFVPQGWQDTAIAIDDTVNRYVYASWRVWDKATRRWGAFQPPILWSNWGVRGLDGDGVQYVFKLFDHELSQLEREETYKPTRQGLEPTQDGEWIPSGWSDDPVSTTSQMKWCYCSTIKRIGGEWGDFETLALWSKWSEDGTSPLFADLDNEMDSVACDADGHPTSEQTVQTGVSLFLGGERRAATIAVYKDRACEQAYTNSETLASGLAVYWTTGARSSGHVVSVKVGSGLTISGKMEFFVKVTDAESGVFRLLVFTVNGVRPGAKGENAVIYNIKPSQSQVSVGRNADDSYNPSYFSLTCGYTKNDGGMMTVVANVRGKIDDTYCLYYRLRNRSTQLFGNYVRYDTMAYPLQMLTVATYDQVEFVLSTEDSFTAETIADNTIIDRETVPVVSDGSKGDEGNDAVTVSFSRNPVIFQGTSLGVPTSTAAITTMPTVYVGGTPVNITDRPTVVSCPTGLTVTVSAGVIRDTTTNTDTYTVNVRPTNLNGSESSYTGTVRLSIPYAGGTVIGSFVTSVSHAGVSGSGMKEIFMLSETKPSTPTGTSVLPSGWSEQPPVITTGLTYSVTGDWSRSGNTLTSPSDTEDDGVYRSRVTFNTSGKATIAVRLTVSSETNYDWAAISQPDNDILTTTLTTADNIKSYVGTDLAAKLSGNGTTQVCLLTVDAAGSHYFDVVYAKDGSNSDYNDNAKAELNVDVATAIWVSTSRILTAADGTQSAEGWSEPVQWNGPQGKMGRNYYYAGIYSASATYNVTDYEAPFVSYNNSYYVRIGEGSCTGIVPTNTDYWALMTSTFKYLITEAIFSSYAKLGSWVFNGDYMFSSKDKNGSEKGSRTYYGMTGDSQVTTGFIPTVQFDAANGRASFSGDKVRFNPNGSGWLADHMIYWDANGNATFEGEIIADSGTIAGFQINSNYLGTQNDGYSQGFSMSKERLVYYNGQKSIIIDTSNNQAISVAGFTGGTALFTNGGDVLHKLGTNDSFTIGDASTLNKGEAVILSKFEARGDVILGGAVETDNSAPYSLPTGANTRKGQLLLFSSGSWDIDTNSTAWIYNENGTVVRNGGTFERTGPFALVCVGFNSSGAAMWQYFNGR